MKRLMLGVLVTCLLSCHQTASLPAPAVHNELDDVRAVEKVLADWYTAMERHDAAGVAKPLTASFFIYEDTVKYRRAELLEGVISGFAAGVQTSSRSDFETRVRGDVAWTSFRNLEVVTPTTGESEILEFLETVVFVKEGGNWMIDRYHATRVNRPR